MAFHYASTLSHRKLKPADTTQIWIKKTHHLLPQCSAAFSKLSNKHGSKGWGASQRRRISTRKFDDAKAKGCNNKINKKLALLVSRYLTPRFCPCTPSVATSSNIYIRGTLIFMLTFNSCYMCLQNQ